ncbi:MAG: GWxTD domain-containing protein [Gemmatimonadales bacterium]|nr:GWxTD domain-containing protein [Gemmatimonadales bacterium]
MIVLLLAALILQDPVPDDAAARVESLLAAGDVPAALRLATTIAARDPRDARAQLLLGRAHFARRVIGRYPALDRFRTAARLAPRDPEPLYWQMKVGFHLRGDEGEIIAREALLRLFALTPEYADAWERFQDVYRNPKVWRRAERALATHGEARVALERRAELLLSLEDAARADSLLAVVMARHPPTSRACLLRGTAAFLDGRIAAGYAWHDSAITLAGADSSEALWKEAWVIASPEEADAYTMLLAEDRPAFFRRFWQRRDPNLLTPENERVWEHATRVAESRAQYRLLHPQRSIYHSAKARTLGMFGERRELTDLAWRVDDVQETTLPRAFRAGLTAQGLVFIRHGRPDEQAPCVLDLRRPLETPACYSHLDVEGWLYHTPDGPVTLGFSRGGEFFKPVTRDQVQTIGRLLQTDRSALPAPLAATAWLAFFRSAHLGLTDVYIRTAGDTAAARVWDAVGESVPAVSIDDGILALNVPPGRYDFGLDVDSAGSLGRLRGEVQVPWFASRGAKLSLSTLVIASAATLLDRDAALRGMPADFTYPASSPLAAYLEIYGLTTDADGRSQYRVRYTFEPVRALPARLLGMGAGSVVFEFDRAAPSGSAMERLVIDPDRLAAGRYRVAVAVTDLRRNVKSESASLDIVIR